MCTRHGRRSSPASSPCRLLRSTLWCDPLSYQLLQINSDNGQGTAGNLGMYGSGILVGMLVDAKGPRPAVLLGALSLGIGYFPIYRGGVYGGIELHDEANNLKLIRVTQLRRASLCCVSSQR